MVNASNHTKCVLLSDQKYIIQPTRINLHPNEDNQEFHCYPTFNTLDNSSNKVCVPNKKEDLNLSVFNMITGMNVIEINAGIKKIVDVTVKNIIYEKKLMFGMLLYIIMKMKNIMNDYRLHVL